MAEDEVPDFLVGDKGVNIVASPIHTPDHGLLAAQNVEFKRVFGVGGLGSRDGMAPLNADVLAGPVMAFIDVPLDTQAFGGGGGGRNVGIYLGVDIDGTSRVWLYSADGTTFVDVAAASLPYPSKVVVAPSAPHTAISRSGTMFFVSSSNQLISWDGLHKLIRLPTASYLDLFVADGGIYLTALAATGTVSFYQPSTGLVTVIPNVGPFLQAIVDGNLTIAYGFVMWSAGSLYRRQEPSGTFFVQFFDDSTVYYTCATFGGILFAAQWSLIADTVQLWQFDAVGAQSNLHSHITTGAGGFEQLFVGQGLLFVSYRDPTGATSIIESTPDGVTWSTEVDVVGTLSKLATAVPGTPFVFAGDLYWPYRAAIAANGFLLKRTALGVWSVALTGKALTGVGAVVS